MAPKTKDQFAEERERSRQKIMDAALDLFANNGYQNTSISQIARRAGISKGLIYNYFNSKDSLLESIVMQGLKEFEKLYELINPDDTPYMQLKTLLTASFEIMKREKRFWQLYISIITQTSQIENLQKILKQMYVESIQIFSGLFQHMGAKHPELEARKLAALLDGISLHYLFVDEYYPLDKMTSEILEQYSHTQ